jgi:hypothetical protein
MDEETIEMISKVKIHPTNLGCLKKRYRDDKDVVLAAVTKNGKALKFASVRLQNDKDVVLAAVTQNGKALEFASVRLQNDKDVVLVALEEHVNALKFASKELRKNEHLILEVVKYGFTCLEYVDKELLNDERFLYYIYMEFTKSIYGESYENGDEDYNRNEYQDCCENYSSDDYGDHIGEISEIHQINDYFSERIQNELLINPKYLLDFAPVNVKPAK